MNWKSVYIWIGSQCDRTLQPWTLGKSGYSSQQGTMHVIFLSFDQIKRYQERRLAYLHAFKRVVEHWRVGGNFKLKGLSGAMACRLSKFKLPPVDLKFYFRGPVTMRRPSLSSLAGVHKLNHAASCQGTSMCAPARLWGVSYQSLLTS